MHHEVFRKFRCWEGYVQAGFDVNFLGVMTRTTFAFIFPPNLQGRGVKTSLPVIDEEYFEWIDVLEAVVSARTSFTMLEVGAGWGRWLANAAAAVREYSGLPYFLVGVEAEPTHFEWMKLHLRDNRIDPRRCRLVQAAAADHDGYVWFRVGDPYNWYGQAIEEAPLEAGARAWRRWMPRLGSRRQQGGQRTIRAKAISLWTLLGDLQMIDLLDVDIQGAELRVLTAAVPLVKEKIKRVHLGTHGEEIEAGLREMFRGMGWKSVYDYPANTRFETQWGPVAFGDGVQSWVNPRFA